MQIATKWGNQVINYSQDSTHNKDLICNKIFKPWLVQVTTKIQIISKLQVATKLFHVVN